MQPQPAFPARERIASWRTWRVIPFQYIASVTSQTHTQFGLYLTRKDWLRLGADIARYPIALAVKLRLDDYRLSSHRLPVFRPVISVVMESLPAIPQRTRYRRRSCSHAQRGRDCRERRRNCLPTEKGSFPTCAGDGRSHERVCEQIGRA